MQQGSHIGRYRIIRRVGSGGMALTFLCALDGAGGFQKDVVIKMLDPERLDDPRFLDMFLDEARLWARFSHPNIPQVFELGTLEGTPYIVMEYVPGPTLHQLSRKLGTRTKRDLHRIARIGADIARALDYAYYGTSSDGIQLKVVHRDVTLNNILLPTAGRPSLIDFGIALTEDRLARTEIGMLKGRIQYMAPEQLLDKAADHRTDLFQLGITLYHLVTGRAAFVSESKSQAAMWKARMEGKIVPILTLVPTCPPLLAEVIERCIRHEPTERPERGAHLADALDAVNAAAGAGPIETSDLAAWVRELFPKQEWTAATGLGALASSASVPTDESRASSWTSRLSQVQGGGMRVASALQPSVRGWTAVIATLIGGFGVIIVMIAGLAGLLLALQLRNSGPGPQLAAAEQTDPNRAATVFLDEVERLVRIERHRDAGVLLLKAREAAPTDPEVIVRLSRVSSQVEDKLQLAAAMQALAAGDFDAAAERAREILDIQPTHPEALDLLEQVSEARTAAAAASPAPAEVDAATGVLFVTTRPSARVFIDDRPYGSAPLSDVELPVGTHTVDFRLAGYSPVRRRITVRADGEIRLDVTLEQVEREPEANSDRLSSLVAAVAPEAGADEGSGASAPAAPVPAAPSVAPSAPAPGTPDAPAPGASDGLSPASGSAGPEAPAPSGTPDGTDVEGPLPAPLPAPPPPGTAELTSDVAPTKQAIVLTRALMFDSKLPGRLGDKLVVASLFVDGATKKRAARMNSEFSNLNVRIGGKLLTTTTLEFTSGEALSEALTSQGIDVLYVPSGMGAQVAEIARSARSAHVLTVGAEPSYVGSGLSLGVFNKNGTAVLALNGKAATAEGAAFGGEVLKIAERMD